MPLNTGGSMIVSIVSRIASWPSRADPTECPCPLHARFDGNAGRAASAKSRSRMLPSSNGAASHMIRPISPPCTPISPTEYPTSVSPSPHRSAVCAPERTPVYRNDIRLHARWMRPICGQFHAHGSTRLRQSITAVTLLGFTRASETAFPYVQFLARHPHRANTAAGQ